LANQEGSRPRRAISRRELVRPVSAAVAAMLATLSGACTVQPGTPTPKSLQQPAEGPTAAPTAAASPPTPTAAPPPPTQAPAPTAVPPTAAPPPPTPQPAQDAVQIFIVANTVSDGESLRPAPASPNRIKVWKDGTELVSLGDEQTASGRLWKKVRDPDNNVGWVAADFLRTSTGNIASNVAVSDPTAVATPTVAPPPPTAMPPTRPPAPPPTQALAPTQAAPRPAAPVPANPPPVIVAPPTPRPAPPPTQAPQPAPPPIVYPAPRPGAPGHTSHASHASHSSHVSGRR
jgi:hypothetical protein